MKLKHIRIETYGKWKNSEWDLEGSVLFFGHNESGKSTILEFIEGVLFGFQKDLQEGCSGSLLFISGEDTWYIERRQSRSRRGEAVVKRSGQPAAVTDFLREIDRTTFRYLYRIDLDQLRQMEAADPGELNQRLFDTSLTGITSLFSGQETARKKSRDLFKPRGRTPAVNKLVSEMNHTKRLIEDWKKKLDQYAAVKEEIGKTKKSLAELNEKESQINDRLKEEELKERLRPLQRSLQAVETEDAGFSLPENARENYEEIKRKLQEAEKQEAVLRSRQKEVPAFSVTDNDILELQHLLESSGKAELYKQQAAEAAKEAAEAERQELELTDQFPSDIDLRDVRSDPPLQKKLESLAEEERTLIIQEKQLRQEQLTAGNQRRTFRPPGKVFSYSAYAGAAAAAAAGEWIGSIFLLLLGTALLLVEGKFKKEETSASPGILKMEEYWEKFHKEKDNWCEAAGLPYGLEIAMCRYAQEAAVQWRELSRKKQILEEKRRQAEEWLSWFRRASSEAAGLPETEEASMHVQALKQTASERQKEQQRLEKQKAEQERVNEQLQEVLAEIKQWRKKQQDWLQSVPEETEEQFYTVFEEEKKKRRQKEEADNCRRQINAVVPDRKVQQKLLQEIEREKGEEKNFLQEEAAAVKDEKEQLYEKKRDLEQKIQSMEEEGAYAALQQQYESQKGQLKKLITEWAVYTAEDKIAEDIRGLYEKEKQPHVLQNASRAFMEMTEGKYSRLHLSLEGKSLTAERRDGAVFSPGQLSTGTRELLYCALRFALVEVQAALPVFLDEAVVNMDEPRRRRFWQTLKFLSRHHQVLFFTCHEHIVSEWKSDFTGEVQHLSALSENPSVL